MEITGKIVHIFDTQAVSDKFQKRAFAVEFYDNNPQYTETVQLEFHQDKCDLLNKYEVGQQVTVGFNLRGRSWTDKEGITKYFNTLQAWKISDANGGAIEESADDGMPF